MATNSLLRDIWKFCQSIAVFASISTNELAARCGKIKRFLWRCLTFWTFPWGFARWLFDGRTLPFLIFTMVFFGGRSNAWLVWYDYNLAAATILLPPFFFFFLFIHSVCFCLHAAIFEEGAGQAEQLLQIAEYKYAHGITFCRVPKRPLFFWTCNWSLHFLQHSNGLGVRRISIVAGFREVRYGERVNRPICTFRNVMFREVLGTIVRLWFERHIEQCALQAWR